MQLLATYNHGNIDTHTRGLTESAVDHSSHY